MSRAVIVGGGPAGAAAAITLARAGAPPLLLEREADATEKVCGEFLAEDAARLLAALGVDLMALGALPLRRAIFAAGGAEAAMPLPFPAWSLPRATLDAALLEAARVAGAELRLGQAVRAAEPAGAGWRLRLGGETIAAEALILATGKHELRGVRRPATGDAIGVKLALAGEVPQDATILLACRGGYAGLQPRAGGGANLCAALVADAPGVAAAARSAEGFVAHVAAGSRLAERLLRNLRPLAARPMAVAGIPYGFLHRGEGPFRVGDQAAVIPSFCGDGVAMALASGRGAARALREGRGAAAHHAAWAASVRGGLWLGAAMGALGRRAPRLLLAGIGAAPGLARWAALRTRLGPG